MTQNASGIKVAIANHLDNLVGTAVLGSWVQVDLNKNPLDTSNYGPFPVAILGMDETKSEYLTNRENYRSYTFQILIMAKYEDTSNNSSAIEDLKDSILNEFDNDPTLSGAAVMVDAAITPSIPVSSPDKTYVLFLISLTCHAIIELTFKS